MLVWFCKLIFVVYGDEQLVMLSGVKIGIGLTITVCVHRAVQLVTDKFVIVPAVGAVPPVAVYVIDDDVTELTV
jgi:hypothetical protein